MFEKPNKDKEKGGFFLTLVLQWFDEEREEPRFDCYCLGPAGSVYTTL